MTEQSKAAPEAPRAVRIFWMDAARSLALLGIVGCHVFALENSATEELWRAGSRIGFISQTLFLYLARFGVPFFLMLSGALLLRKKFRSQEEILQFYKHSLLPLFAATELWIVILHVWYYLATPGAVLWSADSLKILVRDLLLWKDSLYTHMWYMKEILSVYFFIPFAAMALQRLEKRVIRIPFFFLLYCMAGLHTASMVWRMVFGESFYYCPDFVMFFVYLILGYWIVEEGLFRRIPAAVLCLVPVLAAALQLAAVLWELDRVDVWSQMISYSNVFIFAGSVAAFALLSRAPVRCALPGAERAAAFVSKRSFGAYITHFPILIWMVVRFPALLEIRPTAVRMGVSSFLAAALAVFLVAVLGWIPCLRKFLLHIK